MTMDRSTITQAITDLDDELALLTRRRQLLEEVLATYGGAITAVPAAPIVPAVEATQKPAHRTFVPAAALDQVVADLRRDAVPAAPIVPAVEATQKPALRKWNYAEVAKAVRNAPGDIPAARHLSRLYCIPEKTGYHLIKRCRELGHLDDPQVPFVPAAALDQVVADLRRDAAARPKTPVRDLPKAKPSSGMFDPQAVAEALGGAA